MTETKVQCCIAGGGPAGMMLGYLLGRAGVSTLVLEKHADFLRDFRGDTVHPSTLEIMRELGLLDDFLKRPHTKVREIAAEVEDESFKVADFTLIPATAKFIAFMPQWEFLDFLAQAGRALPSLQVKMRAEVTKLIERDGRVCGVEAATPDGPLTVHADLVVACDGRSSDVRALTGLQARSLGAPIDVLWFRLSKRERDPETVLGRIRRGAIIVTIDRTDYWQCAFVISKGGAEQIRARGIEAFRASVADAAPFLRDRVQEIASFDDVKLLSVAVDRLERWSKPGVLCIGDAAHAMSPVGGVGINLAIQDAVAAANMLAAKLRSGTVRDEDLERVRKRRMFAVRIIQAAQLAVQNRVLSRVLSGAPVRAPGALRVLDKNRWLRRFPAQVIGLGVRQEHVRSPLA
jgi:2-polyprenyl-6-methoxyphenol hydroxylase-like FAD-dependent oxidoreductase